MSRWNFGFRVFRFGLRIRVLTVAWAGLRIMGFRDAHLSWTEHEPGAEVANSYGHMRRWLADRQAETKP